jgi:hypothetical protein
VQAAGEIVRVGHVAYYVRRGRFPTGKVVR